MAQYYYTVSSLPTLSIETNPGISVEQFLYECEAEIPENKMTILTNTTLVPPKTEQDIPRILKEWYAYATTFQNQLIQSRAKKLNRNPKDHLRYSDAAPEAYTKANASLSIDNPLEAEIFQINSQYQFLDDLEVGHIFDFDFLLIYKLKLELLLRKFSFTREKGLENFNHIDEHFSSIISSGGIHE